MDRSLWVIVAFAIFLGACSSSGTLGIVTKSSADAGS